jgi:hypothetical protein
MLQTALDHQPLPQNELKASFLAAHGRNNVLVFTECIRLFSHKSCANFFLATLKDVLSCDVTDLKRFFRKKRHYSGDRN